MTGIQIHDKREKDGTSHTNEDIDWSKTNENIYLIDQQERFRTVVSNRIEELNLKRQPRSDATVMCQCLITSDNEFFQTMNKKEQIEYFEKSFEFIKQRYGERNIVSATIHYDERTPHMHVNFVPVTEDGRLSAKDLFSPKSLRVLQDDYNRYVRENGYDLQRGEIDSKNKHLEVEKYKVETKYAELKSKQQELEKLEQIDKEVHLDAEKGKLTYSTKEVDAIKIQNKALKVELHKKNDEIQKLNHDLKIADKMLIRATNELDSTKNTLDHLKGLEIENRALQEIRKSNPDMNKVLYQFDKMKNQAYSFGEKMAKYKEIYHNAIDDREQLINRSSVCEKMIKDLDTKVIDLKEIEISISSNITNELALKAELELLKGIFKKKARDDCQSRLEQQEKERERLITRLKEDHDTLPEYIKQKYTYYADQKQNFINEKAKIMEQTDNLERISKQAVYTYKYHKALSDCQQADLREITDRISAKVKLRPGEDKTFRLTQDDRLQLLKDFEGKIAPNIIEKCKENFKQQDIQERQERNQTKFKQVQSRGSERDRSR